MSQRELGLSPWNWPMSAADVVRGALLPGAEPLRFATERQGDLAVVTLQRGENAVRWFIDPSRDWSVTRVEHLQKGVRAAWSQSVLERIDGVWFPRRTAYFSMELNGGELPISEIIVQAAALNSADVPKALSPADLGFDVGTSIDVYDARARGRGMMKWDGRSAVPLAEYNERVRRGELRDGPGFIAAWEQKKQLQAQLAPPPGGRDERARARRPVWERFKNRWEDYTDRFIAHYRLDGDLSQAAERILNDCCARADEYSDRNQSAASEIEEREDRLHAIAGADARQAAIAEAREELRKFLLPVDEIFENCLKRRLDALPTRAQRAAAEAPTTSSAPSAK